MLFATDVDSTLVYPARTQPAHQPTEPAEIRDGRVLTVASTGLRAALVDLRAAGVTLLPVTARSRTQLEALVQLRGARLAITAGGGRVWQDGNPVPGWDAELRRALDGAATVDQARRLLARRLARAAWVIGEELIEERFFFLMAPHGELPADVEGQARGWLSGCGWTAHAHGRKLYCLPERMRKETALGWLVDHLGERLVAAAGDSELDAKLLAMAPVALCPRSSSLAASPLLPAHAIITAADCTDAGPEIVHAVADLARAGTGCVAGGAAGTGTA